MTKRIFPLLLAVCLMLCFALPAAALDVPQDRNDCTIQLLVQHNGEDLSGGSLTAVKVGYVATENGDYFFCREADHVRLENIHNPDSAAALLAFYESRKDSHTFFTKAADIQNGKALFADMPTGLYLIMQEEPCDGYLNLNPFLLSVPYLQDGEYLYDVTAAIKTEPEPDTTPPPSSEPPTTPSEDPSDPPLPQTGQLNWPIPLLAVAGLLLFALGWCLRFGKKSERYEA